jgi:hypothetical protein
VVRELTERAIPVAGYAVAGFLLVFMVAISGIVVVSLIALVSGASTVDIGLGPVPLMSFRNGAAGYGFQSGWGVGAMAYLGAIGGGILAVRRQTVRRSR